MNEEKYKLANVSGRISAILFVPMAALTVFVCMRSYDVEGTTYIVVDWTTIIALAGSLLLALFSGFWWDECGESWLDILRLAAACAPFLILLWKLDPSGSINRSVT